MASIWVLPSVYLVIGAWHVVAAQVAADVMGLPRRCPLLAKWTVGALAHYVVHRALDSVVEVTQPGSFARSLLLYSRMTELLWVLYRGVSDVLNCRIMTDIPSHRVRYSVANIGKGVVLAILTFACIPYMSDMFHLAVGEAPFYKHLPLAKWIQTCMLVYGATDLAQFGNVRMNRVTLAHHVLTSFVGAAAHFIPVPVPPLITALAFFGLTSSATFLVNIYLGVRHLWPNAGWLSILRSCAFYTYQAILGVNGGIQLALVIVAYQNATDVWTYLTTTSYVAMISVFLYADIVLLRALAPGN